MSIPSLKDLRAIAVALGGARQILTSHQGAAVVVAGEARTFNASVELANIDAALRLVGAAPAPSTSSPAVHHD